MIEVSARETHLECRESCVSWTQIVFFFVALCSGATTLAPDVSAEVPSGTWERLAPAPTERTEVAAAVLNGKIYVIGGFEKPSLSNFTSLAVTDSVHAYDPAQDHWSIEAPLPVKVHHAGAATVGGHLYVIGGFTASLFSVWNPVATAYRHDPSDNSWSELPSMPTARGALAVGTIGGKLYAVGGYGEDGNSGALEVYDPEANRWTSKASLPTPRDHLAVAVVGGRLYAIGGRLNIDYGQNLSSNEAYDPVADDWSAVAPMPTARSGLAAAVIHDHIYVVGGEAPEGTFQTNEAYSPPSDSWQPVAPMPTGRHGLGAAALNNTLYAIAGGPTPGGSFSNVTERYTPPGPRAAGATRGRASSKQVGAVMAMLATFQDAGVLPPESSPDANHLIRTLIQLQAAFSRSPSPAVQQLLSDALAAQLQTDPSPAIEQFRNEGWNSLALEAVVDYINGRSVLDKPDLAEGLRAYSITSRDLELISHVFLEARSRLASNGSDVHQVFAKRRREMPGGRS